jgi:hypothetical protein
MKRILLPIAALALLFPMTTQVSFAQDDPPPKLEQEVEPDGADDPPAAEPVKKTEPPVAVPKSDPVALELLSRAAKRQGGAGLATPGGLNSFFVTFGRILVWRWTQGDDGNWTSLSDEVSKMDITWMRHEGKPSSLRTFWELNGRGVTRAVYNARSQNGYYWLYDGKQLSSITEETHPDDYAEVNSHRRLSEALIDVAVLAKLAQDGSVWTVVEDTAHPGPALRRTPPAKTGGLTFTMWLDEKTDDPRFVRVEAVDKQAPTMHYELRYQDDLPKEAFSVAGAKLRFPREVVVQEQYAGTPIRQVMQLWVTRVVFNAVDEKAAFAPPR